MGPGTSNQKKECALPSHTCNIISHINAQMGEEHVVASEFSYAHLLWVLHGDLHSAFPLK